MAAFFRQIGGGKIYGDAVIGQGEADRRQSGAHPLAAFRNRFVGQADHGKGILTGREMHLHLARNSIDTLKSNRIDIGNHDFFLLFDIIAPSLGKNRGRHKQGLWRRPSYL